MFRTIRTQVLGNRKGVTAAEYAILAVGVVMVVGSAINSYRQPLIDAFLAIGTQITAAQSSIAAP